MTEVIPPTDAEIEHLKALGLECVDVTVYGKQFCRNCQHNGDRLKWSCRVCKAHVYVDTWNILSAYKPWQK